MWLLLTNNKEPTHCRFLTKLTIRYCYISISSHFHLINHTINNLHQYCYCWDKHTSASSPPRSSFPSPLPEWNHKSSCHQIVIIVITIMLITFSYHPRHCHDHHCHLLYLCQVVSLLLSHQQGFRPIVQDSLSTSLPESFKWKTLLYVSPWKWGAMWKSTPFESNRMFLKWSLKVSLPNDPSYVCQP